MTSEPTNKSLFNFLEVQGIRMIMDYFIERYLNSKSIAYLKDKKGFLLYGDGISSYFVDIEQATLGNKELGDIFSDICKYVDSGFAKKVK